MRQHVLDREAELFEEHVARRGGAEAVEPQDAAFRADVAFPPQRHPGFDGQALRHARGQDFDAVKRYEADGLKRPLAPGEIGFEVRREGEVPGEHTVILFNESERLEFKHAVSSRRVFADGALRAAKWLCSQPPGLYGVHDVLFAAQGG